MSHHNGFYRSRVGHRHSRRQKWLLVGFLSTVACANAGLGDEKSEGQATSLGATEQVPGIATTGTAGDVPTAGAPTQSGSQALNPGPQLNEPGKAAALPGMSMRWAHDTSRCMSRTTLQQTLGDRIVMAACASDARQAFSVTSQHLLSVGNNLCVGRASDSNEVQLTTCGDGTVALVINDFTELTLRNLNGDSFFIRPQTGAATLGQPLIYVTFYNAPNILAWNFVGVGNVGGTMLSLVNTDKCLSRSGSSPALASCDSRQAAQRWRMDSGLFANDAGGCLNCDSNSLACSMGTCDASAAARAKFPSWQFAGTLAILANPGGTFAYLGADTSADSVPTLKIGYQTIQAWQIGATP